MPEVVSDTASDLRSIDIRIAEHLGWKNIKFRKGWLVESGTRPDGLEFDMIPRYTTDIAAAWTLLESVINRSMFPLPWPHIERMLGGHWFWRVTFCSGYPSDSEFYRLYEGDGDTAPLAICRAYIAAEGIE